MSWVSAAHTRSIADLAAHAAALNALRVPMEGRKLTMSEAIRYGIHGAVPSDQVMGFLIVEDPCPQCGREAQVAFHASCDGCAHPKTRGMLGVAQAQADRPAHQVTMTFEDEPVRAETVYGWGITTPRAAVKLNQK